MKRSIKCPVKSKAQVVAAANFTDKEQAANDRKLIRDAHIDELNPTYMYPALGEPYKDRYLKHAKPPPGQWLTNQYDDIGEDFVPSENHVYTQEELGALAREAPTVMRQPRPWQVILQEARSMQNNVHMKAGTLGNVMAMDGEYSDQEYIDLACLVDPGRELKFKTDQKMAPQMIAVVIDSLTLPARKRLSDYDDNKKGKHPQLKRKAGATMIIFKKWLKNYLDFFDPGFYETIITGVEGTKVWVLKDQLGSDNPEDYQFSGKLETHEEIVPLTKGHRLVVPDSFFVDKYGTHTSLHDKAKYRTYTAAYAKKCNPDSKGEKMSILPFPKCRMLVDDPVPEIEYQITGIRAEVRHQNDDSTIRWLGLQNSRYVALPWEWVEFNIDDVIIQEAKRRGLAKLRGRKNTGESATFMKLPPGDARDDDPPESIRDQNRGLNYYYQGQIDNCLMGGFANAIFYLMGGAYAKELLESWSPAWHASDDRWSKFQEHASRILSGSQRTVVFPKQPKVISILEMDDSMPILVQLRSRDGSETHAITIFKNNIYDGASRYVLSKTTESLHWCCGKYGFDRVLKTYTLKMNEVVKTKKRSRHA